MPAETSSKLSSKRLPRALTPPALVKTEQLPELEDLDAALPPTHAVHDLNKSFLIRSQLAGYITGEEARQRLGMDMNEWRSLTRRGLLKRSKRKGTGGEYLYAISEIENLLRERDSWQQRQATDSKKLDSLMRAKSYFFPAHMTNSTPYVTSQAFQVFALLNEGENPISIVEKTGLHPAVVMTIVKDHAYLQGGFLVNARVLQSLNELKLPTPEPLRTVEDLQKLVVMLIRERACQTCKPLGRPRMATCRACTLALFREQATRDKALKAVAKTENAEKSSD